MRIPIRERRERTQWGGESRIAKGKINEGRGGEGEKERGGERERLPVVSSFASRLNTWILIKHAHRDYREQVKVLFLLGRQPACLRIFMWSGASTMSPFIHRTPCQSLVLPASAIPSRKDKKGLPEDSGRYPLTMRRLNDESADVRRACARVTWFTIGPCRIISFDREPSHRERALPQFAAGERLTE